METHKCATLNGFRSVYVGLSEGHTNSYYTYTVQYLKDKFYFKGKYIVNYYIPLDNNLYIRFA